MTRRIRLERPNLPAIPASRARDATAQRVNDATKETLETMRGARGDPLDRAVFIRDLVATGLLDYSGGGIAVGPAVPPVTGVDPNDSTTPPLLTNLQATAGFSYVLLTWNDPQFRNLGFYELWRKVVPNDAEEDPATPIEDLMITPGEHAELAALYVAAPGSLTAAQTRLRDALAALNDASLTYNAANPASSAAIHSARLLVSAAYANDALTATRIGTSQAPIYSDHVDRGRSYLYWVRAVSAAGVAGPFNAQGLLVTTQPDIEALMKQLTAEVNKSLITQWILHGVDIEGEGWGASATFGDAFTQQNAWATNLDAGYGVRVGTSVGGVDYIAGFGLNLHINGDGTADSTFIVAADTFAVVDPSRPDAAVLPFMITEDPDDPEAGMKVWINIAMINKASITQLIAGSVIADFITAGAYLEGAHLRAGSINMGEVVKDDPDDPSTWVYTNPTLRQGNFSVDEAGFMEARHADLYGCVIRDLDGNPILDADGGLYSNSVVSTGNPITASNIGVFIGSLAVNALHIQGNAVTVPNSATWAGSRSLSGAYQALVTVSFTVPGVLRSAITEEGAEGDAIYDGLNSNIPVILTWGAETTAQNSNADYRRFRVRRTGGDANDTVYETNANAKDIDQFNGTTIKTTMNAGETVTWVLEAKGSGIVFQASLVVMAVRR